MQYFFRGWRLFQNKKLTVGVYGVKMSFPVTIAPLMIDYGKCSSEINLFDMIGYKAENTTRCSYAGVELNLVFFGYAIVVEFRDTRQWDEYHNRWEID